MSTNRLIFWLYVVCAALHGVLMIMFIAIDRSTDALTYGALALIWAGVAFLLGRA